MRARLLLLLLAVAVTSVQGNAELALASWTAGGAGTSGARAEVLAPPTGLTVTGQSCTPTSSGLNINYRDGLTATGDVTVVANRPAGTVTGDLLVAAYTLRNHTAVITPPSGWTELRIDPYSGKNIQTGIWTHTAAAGDPASWTWTANVTGFNAIVAMAAYSGASGVSTSAAATQTTASVTAPSITPTSATRLVGLFANRDASVTMSTADGMTNRLQYSTAALGGNANQITLQLSDEPWYSATATGTRSAALSGSKDNIGQLLALTPTAPVASTISYVGDTEGFGGASFTVAAPAGIQTGDVMLIGYGKRKTAPTVTTPTGWTLLQRDYFTTNDYQQIIYYRVATAADTAGTTYTLASSDTTKSDAILVAYRGVDQTNPIVTNSSGGDATQDEFVTAPSITPTRADTRLVGFFGSSDGRTLVTSAAGMTDRQYVASGAGGAEVELIVQDERWSSANTATGSRTIELSNSGRAVGHLVALKAESYPLAALSWTASASSYADGYRLGRSVGGTETVVQQLGTVTSYTVGNTNRLTGGLNYTMNLKAKANNWLSTADTYSFTAISTC